MKLKSIKHIIAPRPPHFVGDGFRVHNFIPSMPSLSMQEMSPFIMLDYGAKHHFPPSDQPRGVDVHPHRGFETVTIAYKGRVAHHDSAGNSGVIGEGDVQWMTAASGVLHKEYHEESWSRAGGYFQMVQLWVNLPAKDKMSTPKYQEITNNKMVKVNVGGDSSIELIAGQYGAETGPANTFTPVHLSNAKLKAGAEAHYTFPTSFNSGVLMIEGEAIVNGEAIPENHFVSFQHDGETIDIKAVQDSIVLVLSGEPINEPIAAHGPFVMNTRDEIIQAFDDFQNGNFGFLEEGA
jgi:redox-sensitive bicupin YhaK (pirin superfamily)